MSHEIKKTDTGYDITLTRGDTLILQLSLTKNGEAYTPAVGSSIRFAMKEKYTDESVTLEKTVPIDTLMLQFDPADTKELPMGKKYVYDIELTDEVGHVDTFLSGSFKIGNEVE